MSMFPAGSGSRLLLASAVLWGLAACRTSPPAPESPAPVQPVPIHVAPAGTVEYPVVAAESWLQILVYRGGAMARLGHNHVIASHDLGGYAYVAEDLTQSRFDVSIPVSALTIDEPAMREQAGADFPPGVPQSARDGTRANLLSEALLDGTKYPQIRLRATEVVAAGDYFDVDVEITIKDQVKHVRVPVRVERTDGTIRARGEFPLKQSELGLKPFSAAMGALLVVDEMRIRFDVVARDAR
jgi:polyisoprenoid-binding protein YceI